MLIRLHARSRQASFIRGGGAFKAPPILAPLPQAFPQIAPVKLVPVAIRLLLLLCRQQFLADLAFFGGRFPGKNRQVKIRDKLAARMTGAGERLKTWT